MEAKSASKDKKTEQVLMYDAEFKKIAGFKNKWEKIIDYKDGLVIVMDKDNNYGLVDKSGTIVLPVKYSDLSFKDDCILISEKYDNVEEIGFLVR